MYYFIVQDSAEASAEASVKVAEASVSAETNFCRFGRSLVVNNLMNFFGYTVVQNWPKRLTKKIFM